jgi:hypothetical protein
MTQMLRSLILESTKGQKLYRETFRVKRRDARYLVSVIESIVVPSVL